MNLDVLTSQISNLDESLTRNASKAVNTLLTARNWLIGFLHPIQPEGRKRLDFYP